MVNSPETPDRAAHWESVIAAPLPDIVALWLPRVARVCARIEALLLPLIRLRAWLLLRDLRFRASVLGMIDATEEPLPWAIAWPLWRSDVHVLREIIDLHAAYLRGRRGV